MVSYNVWFPISTVFYGNSLFLYLFHKKNIFSGCSGQTRGRQRLSGTSEASYTTDQRLPTTAKGKLLI